MKSLAFLLLACAACAAPLRAQTLEQALELYHQNRVDESLPLFRRMAAASPGSPEARAWLADNLRRAGDAEGALALARQVLRDQPCHAHAHDVAASVLGLGYGGAGGRDSARAHAERGVECDPEDGNLWLTYWMSSLMRGDTAGELRAQRRLGELGFVPEPVMELGRWMLRASPPDALLFANGDWDYFPLRLAQTVEGLRPDVTVVLIPMLEVPSYVRGVAVRTSYPVPPELDALGEGEALVDDEGNGRLASVTGALWAAEWVEGRGARPLVLAATAPADFLPNAWPRWDGPVYTLRPLSELPFGAEVRLHADAFADLLPLLDAARLDGPLTHPSDRSPIRRTGVHPAEYVVRQLYAYGGEQMASERPEEARETLARMEALLATGHVRGMYVDMVELLRETIEQ